MEGQRGSSGPTVQGEKRQARRGERNQGTSFVVVLSLNPLSLSPSFSLPLSLSPSVIVFFSSGAYRDDARVCPRHVRAGGAKGGRRKSEAQKVLMCGRCASLNERRVERVYAAEGAACVCAVCAVCVTGAERQGV